MIPWIYKLWGSLVVVELECDIYPDYVAFSHQSGGRYWTDIERLLCETAGALARVSRISVQFPLREVDWTPLNIAFFLFSWQMDLSAETLI